MALPRVLMFCNQFRPLVGGAEWQAEQLARALIELGCKVEVMTPRLDRAWPAREVFHGVPVERFEVTDMSRWFGGWRGLGVPNLFAQAVQVRRAVRARLGAFDVLHAHLAAPFVAFALEAAHDMGRPALCKIACGGSSFDFKSLRGATIFGHRLERALVADMDRWIAISGEVRDDLLGAGVPAERIVSIPNCIDPDLFGPARVPGAVRRLLCLGRMEKFDVTTLLQAFDRVLALHPELELRLVGRGDLDAIRAQLATLPRARERAVVVGTSPAQSELAWADALVHPSDAEGMSNSLLEAMTVGLPCVASDIPPNREMLGDGEAGLLVPLGDVAALERALHRLVSEPELARRLAATARRRIDEHYALRSVAARYLPLYDELRSSVERRAS